MTTPWDPQSGGYRDPAAHPYGPQPGYGASPGYGPPPGPGALQGPQHWQPAPQTDGTAIAALVLAVCSWVVFPVVPAVIALVLAGNARRDIDAAGGRLTGDGLVTAARVVAWLNIGLCVAGVVLVLLFFGALFSATAP